MSQRRATSLGPTEMFLLRTWASTLREAFGAMPYLVGSVARDEEWRDVDVRVMLDDDDPLLADRRRARALNVALTLWGQHVTRLPIDCQLQATTEGNTHDGPRLPLGMAVWPA